LRYRGRPPPRRAEVLSLVQILLPEDLADRLEGSGVETRSCVGLSGAKTKVDLGILHVNLGDTVALEAGLGMAQQRAGLGAERGGTALSGGVSIAFWKRSGLKLSMEAAAMRAGYDGGSLMDGTLLVALSGR
jgi:hypothetical protein